MIRMTLSVRSKRNTHYCSRHRGFTLVEVMMSLVLLAIGTALAIPSYRDMVEKRQVTNGAEQLASFLNSAQGVAMKTNQVVTISYARSSHENWCIGAVSGETACDCTETDTAASDYCQIATQPFVLNNSHAGGDLELMHAMNGDGAYAFDPIRGLFLDLDDSLTLELHSPSRDFKLNLMVNSTGRVLLCSKDIWTQCARLPNLSVNRSLVMKTRSMNRKQTGATLMEVMVAMSISLVVTASMIALMASTLGSTARIVKMTRLSDDMRVALQVMSRDVRRSSYNINSLYCYANDDCDTDGALVAVGDIIDK